MKREFMAYYLSRAILSAGFAILVMGFTWKAVVLFLILFGLFALYLHSGWFLVDPSHPLTPLRRDEHGRQIQRVALIAAVVVAILFYVISMQASPLVGIPLITGPVALSIGVLTYFVKQFILFARH
jgi:hypothetical protein